MNKLKTYLSVLGNRNNRIEFAIRCDTTLKHLQNVSYGYKQAGESLCINIERESNGAVRCEDLRPDVDWSYLRGTSVIQNPEKAA